MKKFKFMILALGTSLTLALAAERFVDIDGIGTQKFPVSINVSSSAFAKCLAKNLELSGLFQIQNDASIKVTGSVGAIRAEGRGKVVSCSEAFADDASARMAARRFSDAMTAAFSNNAQAGFACDRIVFLKRGRTLSHNGTLPSELCLTYPDGLDIRSLTSDNRMTIFPRWKDRSTIYYISDKNGAPQIWQLDIATGKRSVKWSFKGSPTGIAVSPDGSRLAAVLSFQGNPELYVIDMLSGKWTRLTNTPLASEGQPTWSPDGRKIAYVSNETRTPQIYVVDVATKAKRRLTSRGRENVDPDWGADGNIAYITKRGGAQIAVMSPAEGDATSRIVTEEATWEHPSWSRDHRHLTANRDGALFSVDTLEDGDKPKQLFFANGNWVSPTWSR